jgi:hypothetical protein
MALFFASLFDKGGTIGGISLCYTKGVIIIKSTLFRLINLINQKEVELFIESEDLL